MQLLNYIATALTVSAFAMGASADHVQRRQHQGVSRRMEGDLLESRATSNSKWSWYDTQTGNAGSCGRMLRNTEFVVAMNVPQYKASNCYKSITLSWKGKQTRAQIVDMCPGCPYGGLDLSPSLFQFFSGLGTGIIWDGEWWFDGEGGGAPPPPPKTTKTRTTSRWTPPPTPTPTPTPTSTRTRTRTTSTTPTTTSTREPEPTTTSSTSTTETSSTETSTSAAATNTASLIGNTPNDSGIQQVFSNLIALGGLVAAGAA